jgi:GxxExxY protein
MRGLPTCTDGHAAKSARKATTEITERTEFSGKREPAPMAPRLPYGSGMDDPSKPLTERIIGAAIQVHRALGPGLLESAYEACLAYELVKRGLRIEKQKPLPVVYGDVNLDCAYRLDFVVNDEVVVEVKSVERLTHVHDAQLISYLKLSKKRVGLLINFNVKWLVDEGIRRRVNDPK